MKKVFFVFLFCVINSISTTIHNNNIYIISHFDPFTQFEVLKSKVSQYGYNLMITDSIRNLKNVELIILFNIDNDFIPVLDMYPKEKLIACLWEPATINPNNYKSNLLNRFSKVLTWDDELVDGKKFLKFFLYYTKFSLKPNKLEFDKKKFCTAFVGNKYYSNPNELYTERLNIINFFEKNHFDDFEFFGWDWNRSQFRTYKGSVKNKIDYLKNYKFCICYENTKFIKGYISEKIFDCFVAGSVPIYLGASNINQYIPDGCFIDRSKFSDNESLYRYLKGITAKEYQLYLDNIDSFLLSPQSRVFSEEYFIEKFIQDLILNDTNKGYKQC